jgi:nicotinamide-nucleotide amidase
MKNINAELISIGNELLAGYTVNTNAAYIAARLKDSGIAVQWVTTIADEKGEILDVLARANQRADIIVVTGGLGPTPDDITKGTICEYFKTTLHEDEYVLHDLHKFAKDRNRDEHFIKLNQAQALVPETAIILRNKLGTAPGLILEKDKSVFVFMPGVPQEMKAIFNVFIDFLKSRFNLPVIKTHILRTTAIAESRLHDILKDEIEAFPQFPFSFLPKQIGVDLRFTLTIAEQSEEKQWQDFIHAIYSKAQKYIFAQDERNLENVIIDLLTHRKLSLSVAESFSGGLLQDWLTNVPGSSAVFHGGLVTYSNESKMIFADVKSETLNKFGAVSEQTALEMARGVQQKFKTDCSISTTGIAGPAGGSKEKPVGLCYIAARYKEKEKVRPFNFGNDRKINKMRGAMAGLEMLRRLLLNIN